jgi:hypothetical protein
MGLAFGRALRCMGLLPVRWLDFVQAGPAYCWVGLWAGRNEEGHVSFLLATSSPIQAEICPWLRDCA